MREANRAEKTLRDAEWRPDRASAEAARGCIRFRQEPDTRTGVSSLDTPAMHESYPIGADLTTPSSILPVGISHCNRAESLIGRRDPSRGGFTSRKPSPRGPGA